jgi:peroxiredoxin Q/BCP
MGLTMLEIGDRFPVERLSVKPEGPAVVYFYPADLTPGCTAEARAFNDLYDSFRDAGYEVIGVSIDSDQRHEEFRQECGLRFPLASDEGAELSGSLGLLKQYGDHGTFARRVTFLVDADGTIRKIWDVTDAGAHPEEVLAEVTG